LQNRHADVTSAQFSSLALEVGSFSAIKSVHYAAYTTNLHSLLFSSIAALHLIMQH